ncbi:MAG: uracil-DNA glycosylase family protein [Theionarchaea archaeon]|nr:uracil-DNA glycosylase family protein [Theionarchaea archaeon]
MNVSNHIVCTDFPCTDITTDGYTLPSIEIDPAQVNIFMISEAPPHNAGDYFYASDNSFYLQTTLQAFNQTGADVSSMEDLLGLGIYITTAIKCGKTKYSVSAKTIKNCSKLLEKEMELFPNMKTLLLMGDVAIKALNYIAKRQTGEKVIPSGSTYKIRKDEYSYRGMRVFPSYLQTGKSFLIEKSKQKMIAEDIMNALEISK